MVDLVLYVCDETAVEAETAVKDETAVMDEAVVEAGSAVEAGMVAVMTELVPVAAAERVPAVADLAHALLSTLVKASLPIFAMHEHERSS